MAERLAPEQTPLRVTSRPERTRGRARRWVRRLVALVLGVALLAAGTVATLHFLAIHRSAQEIRATALVPPDMAANVLVVIARPGQELPLAGTLAALDDAGATVSVLSLTDGAKQPPSLDFAKDSIGEVRSDELAASADLLGVDRVTTAAYTDGKLLAADPDEVTATIAAEIKEVAPSVILTVERHHRDGHRFPGRCRLRVDCGAGQGLRRRPYLDRHPRRSRGLLERPGEGAHRRPRP